MSRVFKGETAPNVSEEGESVGAKAGHRSALDKEVRPGGARGQGWRRVVLSYTEQPLCAGKCPSSVSLGPHQILHEGGLALFQAGQSHGFSLADVF